MSISIRVTKIKEVIFNPSVITSPLRYLFVLSHMRSRSSVLSHILGSNDSICGYSELHRSYINYMDILKMRVALYHDLKVDLRGKYLLDKILHNEHEISGEVLKAVEPKVLFLLRNPRSSIKSIIKMGQISGMKIYEDPEKASEYYCSRLMRLTAYAEAVDPDYFFLESDDLVNKTEAVLRDLTKWLGLSSPLTSDYRFFNNTGKPGYGDRSEKIRAGRVIKTTGYPDINIPPELLRAAESAYQSCKLSLNKTSNS
ncbi:sulfotransferase family protein [Marinobacter sp. F4216]|uniref:sulfotransferase family protein n=1 Tax=Marinobacter sp. F4216 TaxID=2874281 RepID=UPI001CBD03D6|nr:sulfotransferase [Marinobacter sp. F4216]MBZ2167857.1 sulfotransferase [Marinobacter sp. F4216]